MGVLNLLCADTAKDFVVPMEGDQLLGSPSVSFSGPQAGTGRCAGRFRTKSIFWLCREGSFLSLQSKVCGCETSPRESWMQYYDTCLPQPWTWPGENVGSWLVYGSLCVRGGGSCCFCNQHLFYSFKLTASCLNLGTGVLFSSFPYSRINEGNKKLVRTWAFM